MGTLITNEKLGIDFEIEKEILQKDLEIYERGLAKYLQKSEYNSESQATLMSALVIGAIDAKFIPSDIVADEDEVLQSKPKKISFLAARIAEVVESAKSEDVDFEFECPEITQGDLEQYEKIRNKIIKGMEFDIYETSVANSIMVQIGIKLGWIPDDMPSSKDEILESKPNKIKYIANQITEALVEARTIPGE